MLFTSIGHNMTTFELWDRLLHCEARQAFVFYYMGFGCFRRFFFSESILLISYQKKCDKICLDTFYLFGTLYG